MSTMVIDGKPASARSGATVEIHDPATGELVDTVPQAGVEETRQAIDAAHAAFRGWADTLPQKRTQILMKGAALARQHLDEVASLLTREQGKPLRDSKIEAERFVEGIEFYAMLAASGAIRGKHVQLSVPGAFGMVVRRPLGVVGAIIPWNFPLTLLARQEGGNLVEVLARQRRPLHQDLGALLRQRVRPAAEGGVRRVDRLPSFLDAGLRNRVDQLAGCGVVDLHGRAGTRRRRLAVNHHRAHGLGIPPDCVPN